MRALAEITVPSTQADALYRFRFAGREFHFHGLKTLLAKADCSKAGQRSAGLAAANELEREAARSVLAGLTLQHLYERPLSGDGKVDEVMRVNYDIDLATFKSLASLSLGELKSQLLTADEARIKAIGAALTGVMAAALAKLCDTHELISIATKINVVGQARTHLGGQKLLSSRLQPKHPSDDLASISALVYAGLALGAGDALIEVSPAEDNAHTLKALYQLLDRIRRDTGAPTQICVLTHINTALRCLEDGAPVEIAFQRIAGTAAANREFDISVATLDHAHAVFHKKSPLLAENPNARCLYFATGQGRQYRDGAHHGMDRTTCEALCYGLARRYQPFMVNNQTGFIGPATDCDHRDMIIANLQDHFIGKLLGLPMGMAPCYTLAPNITPEGQQMATQVLSAAGANFFMDVHLHSDRMLTYVNTSAHDVQSLREICAKNPSPAFAEWGLRQGIFARESNRIIRGPRYGDPTVFIAQNKWLRLGANTALMPALRLAGPRPTDAMSRELKSHQAFARGAIFAPLDLARLGTRLDARILHTCATNQEEYLRQPELGNRLDQTSAQRLRAEHADVQIVIADGWNAAAVAANCEALLEVITDGLHAHGLSLGQPMLVPFARVKLAEDIATRVNAEIVLMLLGERHGGGATTIRSLSCYYLYNLRDAPIRTRAIQFSGKPDIRFEYSILSNIHAGGLPPIEAGSVIVDHTVAMKRHRAAGTRLAALASPG